MIALRLCLDGRNHFLCRRQVEHLLFGKLRGRILRREWVCRENKSKCIGYPHDDFLFHGSGVDTGSDNPCYRDVRPPASRVLARVP